MEKIIDGISVEIIRKRIKNLHLYVTREGKVRVTAPIRLPEREIDRFVRLKRDWIAAHLSCAAALPLPITYSDGDTLCLWGREYTLATAEGAKPGLTFAEDKAILTLPAIASAEQRRDTVREEYRRQLILRAGEYISKWERITGLHPLEFRTKFMKTRWGTCNTAAGRIWLNPHLAWYGEECLDYVALHEIVHLEVHGHGSEFYALLEKHMPDFREREKLLKLASPNILI